MVLGFLSIFFRGFQHKEIIFGYVYVLLKRNTYFWGPCGVLLGAISLAKTMRPRGIVTHVVLWLQVVQIRIYFVCTVPVSSLCWSSKKCPHGNSFILRFIFVCYSNVISWINQFVDRKYVSIVSTVIISSRQLFKQFYDCYFSRSLSYRDSFIIKWLNI